MRLTGCIVIVAGLSLLAAGCSEKNRPNMLASSTFVQVGLKLEGDSAKISSALAVWDAAGYKPMAVKVELRDPLPETIPPNCFGCDPAVILTGSSVGVCGTFPGASIVCARGGEWALVHEMLHVQHQFEGRAPDVFHVDERWSAVNALAASIKTY